MYRLIHWIFRFVRYLDSCRRTKPRRWNIVVTILFAATAVIFRKYVHLAPDTRAILHLDQLRPLPDVHWLAVPVTLTLCSTLTALFFSAFIFPLLAYLPFTIANKDLGIVAASMDARVVVSWMEEAARRTIASSGERIKVVCLTGKHLWQTPPSGSEVAPLAIAASAGKLDVIAPRLDPAHPTVRARFATYTSDFKDEQGIHSEADLVREMNESRANLLSKSSANTITEHGILCMWRIVLTKEFCIVQSYFPNHGGSDSFKAPAFFYRNVNAGNGQGSPRIDSLYDTYAHMVELVRRSV